MNISEKLEEVFSVEFLVFVAVFLKKRDTGETDRRVFVFDEGIRGGLIFLFHSARGAVFLNANQGCFVMKLKMPLIKLGNRSLFFVYGY